MDQVRSHGNRHPIRSRPWGSVIGGLIRGVCLEVRWAIRHTMKVISRGTFMVPYGIKGQWPLDGIGIVINLKYSYLGHALYIPRLDVAKKVYC